MCRPPPDETVALFGHWLVTPIGDDNVFTPVLVPLAERAASPARYAAAQAACSGHMTGTSAHHGRDEEG